MTELKTSHYLKQRSDGRIEPAKPFVYKTDASSGTVLTSDGSGNADFAATKQGWSPVGTETASGDTSLTVTGVPSDATQIMVVLNRLTGSASAEVPSIKFGLGAAPVASGYVTNITASNNSSVQRTTGIELATGNIGASVLIVHMHFTKVGNFWATSGAWSNVNPATPFSALFSSSYDTGGSDVDRVNISLNVGTFDSGDFSVYSQ